LRPTVIASISTGPLPSPRAGRSVTQRRTVRVAFALSEPARPRSVVITIIATRRTGRRARSGLISSVTLCAAATRLSASSSSSA
jgi:hypothetical protein